jgi:menaquinone-dependent protoporphyrinogen IX oxidase
MNIEYLHASKHGNGAKVAEEFQRQMAAKGVTINVHHVKEIKPKEVPPANLYVFSSPGRFGKPIGDMHGFLKKADLTAGTKYAILVTELAPEPEKAIRIPATEEDIGKCQRVIPVMNEMLQKKGMVNVAEGKIFVTGIKGPLERNWQKEVEAFVARIPISP